VSTTSTLPTNATHVVDRYIAIWNEPDPTRRRDLIEQTWTDDATYLDPLMAGEGADGIDAMIAGVQQQFPGYWFRLLGEVDHHHDRVRFSWELTPGDGQPALAAGTDFGVVAPDGRLRSVTGFLDRMPGSSEE
jgi:hypothetical protein